MAPRLTRRGFLGATMGGLAAISVGGLVTSCGDLGQTAVLLASKAPLPERFASPLSISAVKKPIGTAGGLKRYEIIQKAAQVEILPGLKTEIMGYDGTFPGPTIEARSGEKIIVTHRNQLDVPTVVHLHGGHTPAESDGYPIDLVLPESGGDQFLHHGGMVGDVSKGSRDYTYPNTQPAATLWYHDHRMDFTAPQVWRGLAGVHLIRDEVEDSLPLPGGDRDVPLMIMDRSFEADGSFSYPALDPELIETPGVAEEFMSGVLGDVILVNGVPWPTMEVDAARYRFRLLNGSNARRYELALQPQPGVGPPFVQIGSDAGLLAEPIEQQSIVMAAAERFDVIVDFSAYEVGTEVTMINKLGRDGTAEIMRFIVARKGSDDSSIPAKLATIEPLVPPSNAIVRDWRFTRGDVHGNKGWLINNRAFDPHRMDAEPKLGDIEIWRFYTDVHHPIHVHLSPFQVLKRGTRGPGKMDAGWKDTVDLQPAQYLEVAIKFTEYTGKYLMHCHNLEHEDMMMMSAFSTV